MSVETRFSPHTAYHLSFFLLRVPLSIGGQAAQITVSGDGHLAISCRYPPVSITFDSLTTEVETIVKKYGLKGVSNYWCEDAPLFELKLSSQDGFKRFLRSQETVQNELASRIAAMLAQQHKSSAPVVVTAHTEVYMLTPRPERKDARIIQVSSEKELDTCTTLWRESEVFNFGALFRAFRTNRKEMTDNDEVTLAQLTKDLYEVSDWFSLGLHLGVPPAKLNDIKHDLTLRSTQEFRTEMLSVWMKKSGASWPRVVTALMVIGREALAHKIALKYGVPVPTTVEKKLPQVDTSTSQTSMPLQKKLIIQVEKCMREVEAKDKELALKYQSLEEARRQMDVANQRVTETIQSIRQTQTKAINLIQEKMEVEKQLQLKEQELQFLCTHQDSEQLENIIRNKEEEIKKLQQRLHEVESELRYERKLSQELKEQLKQATAELETKSAVERERERATGDLRTSLERERQTVDFLREQLTSASASKEQVECLLSTARHECDSKEKEIGRHKLTISQKDEETKSLFQQLQKQKALITKLDMESAVAREGHSSTKQELELKERILKVTDKADELRKKLEEAEEGRREAVRKMEDAQVESKLLQSQMAELRKQQAKVKVRAPPAPSPPGKPTASDDDIIHNSILLKWAEPHQGGDYVKHYCISYRGRYDPPDQWQTRLSEGAQTALCVSGLDPKTEYCFKVHAVSDYGTSKDSEVSTFRTKVRLAEEMLSSAKLIETGPPAIYQLKAQDVVVDNHNQLRRCAIGRPDPIGPPEEKVMLLGAVGTGKTTLINGMANYLLGVEWGDDFRFKLIVDEGGSQAHGQTEWITAYTFHHQKNSPLPYTITIIDTPGFGNTEGVERDIRDITAQIERFLSMPPPDGIDHLTAIGFVTQATLVRLTPVQKYIFDSILAIFGKNIASNIFMMATFADGGVPPVLAAIKAANIPFCDCFKFNNSCLWAKPNDNFAKMFWKMGVRSFENFFAHLKIETQSFLETVIQALLAQIKIVMSTMGELQDEERVLEGLQVETTDLENQEFKYKVKVVHQRKVDLKPGEHATLCLNCNYSCHYPCYCPVFNDDQLWRCGAMNQSECTVCPSKCRWQNHFRSSYRFETYEEEEERTLDLLSMLKSDYNAIKITIDKIRQKVEDLQAKLYEMICEAHLISARLDEIALKPNPLTELNYIDLLIESEKQECKPGYRKRLEYLQEVRKNAEVIHQIKGEDSADAPQWLKDAVQRAKQNMKKHIHGSQNPHFARVKPTLTHKAHTKTKATKTKWWPF